jgi:hypothetical protein
MKKQLFGMKEGIILSLLVLLGACASQPAFDGTTWVYVNKDNNRMYKTVYAGDTVSFTIYNADGTSVAQEPVTGTYTFDGNTVTEVYGDFKVISTVKGKNMTDASDPSLVFTREEK